MGFKKHLVGLSTLTLLLASGSSLAEVINSGTYNLKTDQGTLEISALRDDILRVRIARAELPEDASFAVNAAQRSAHVPIDVNDTGASIALKTKGLLVHIQRSDLHLSIQDAAGKTLLDDAPAAAKPLLFENNGFRLKKHIPQDMHFFGLGDKTGGLDRRGQSFAMWNTDAYGFQTWSDPLYKAIPFIVAADEQGKAFGLFLDNSWRTSFDFGRTERDSLTIGAEGGPIDYYLLAGPAPKDVVQSYAWLTGTAPLPPRWSLGFQQSRYSYMTEKETRGVVEHLRSSKIPADAIYLDIDYQDHNRPFTVNRTAFPDLQGMMADFKKTGMHTILITDLHIAKTDYPPYNTGKKIDAFVKNAAGEEFVGPVWPGPAVFPDFSRTEVRSWWGGLYKDFVKMGVSGFWNDMNEPAVFETPTNTMPLDNIHHIQDAGFKTRTATHLEMHNLMGMLNSRATYEGLLKLAPNQRPFVLTRASYSGGQRYAATWTGDNTSSYTHLNLATSQLANLGLSGFAYAGDDIGGFTGYAPSADLLTRWTQIGAFNPIFRNHAGDDKPAQENWVHGPDHEAIRRHYIEERYRLLPYIYTLADENSRTGLPLLRPVFLEFPETLGKRAPDFGNGGAFMLGANLLVAPSTAIESPATYMVALPSAGWYDYWTGKQIIAAPTKHPVTGKLLPDNVVLETPSIEKLPVFVRPGSILPRQGLVQSTAETAAGPLELHVYPGANCKGNLYWDDGESFAYQKGNYLRQAFSCDAKDKHLEFNFLAREGKFKPWWKNIALVVHGWNAGEAKVQLGARELQASVNAADNSLTIQLPDQAAAASVVISAK